jgi:hypothetical protein
MVEDNRWIWSFVPGPGRNNFQSGIWLAGGYEIFLKPGETCRHLDSRPISADANSHKPSENCNEFRKACSMADAGALN